MKSSLVRFALRPVCMITLWHALESTSLASPLLPGTSMFPPIEPDPVGGVLAAPVLVSPFNSGTLSGTLVSTVISGDTFNPLGGLTFTYQVRNGVLSTETIDRFTISDFAGFLVDASFQTEGGGRSPASVDRTLFGDTIGFSFIVGPGDLQPGTYSEVLVLQTDAPNFKSGAASFMNSTVASAVSYAPTTIPEPSVLALMGLAIAALAAKHRSSRMERPR